MKRDILYKDMDCKELVVDPEEMVIMLINIDE